MKCPVCKDVTLLMTEKKGVEIDYCPECRGIWLDRGELDKLLEKDNEYNKRYDNRKDDYYEKHRDERDYYDDKHSKKRPRRKESFLGEIFDIFGD